MKSRVFLLLSLTATLQARDYDVAVDFSITNNPEGVWSYGTAPSVGGAFALLPVATNNFGGVLGWNQWSTAVNTTPGIYKNNGSSTVTNGGALVLPGTFVLRPNTGSAVSVVRWTAPSEGYWRVTGRFTGVQAATTDVHVRDSGVPVFNGVINGLGSTQAFAFNFNSFAGETLDFQVGNGGNGDAQDLTSLALTIVNAAVLTIEKQGNNIVLRWPAAATGFELQVNPSPTAPTDWTQVPEFPVMDGSFWKVTHPVVPRGEFFRLHYFQQES